MSNRPNAIYARDVDGDFCLVADAKARRFLNKGFEKPRPRWGNSRTTATPTVSARRNIALSISSPGRVYRRCWCTSSTPAAAR
jgi:hypothetical protein